MTNNMKLFYFYITINGAFFKKLIPQLNYINEYIVESRDCIDNSKQFFIFR